MIHIKESITKKVPGITSLFVTFDYNPQIVDLIKKVDGAYYHKKEKVWECPITSLSTIIDTLCYFDDIELGVIEDTADQPIVLYKQNGLKSKLFDHQVDGVSYGLNHDKWLLLDEPGLGKTLQIIALAKELKETQNLEHCLIVCGINTLKSNWKKEIQKHSDISCRILGERVNRRGREVIGGVKERLAQLKEPIDEFFVITNIETLRDEDIVKNIIKNKNNKFDMIVVDEIHCCKNPSSQQGSNLLKLNKAKYQVGATGTLMLNNPLDTYVPLKWIGADRSTYTNFKYYYCKFGGPFNNMLLGFKNIDVLKEQIERYSLRRDKSLLNLPPKTIIPEYVDLNDYQRIFYDNIVEGVKNDCLKVKLSTQNLLSMVTRLRQATACPSILTTENIESSKISRIVDLCEQIVYNGNKVVIFSTFKDTVYQLNTLLQKFNPLVATGDMKEDVISNNVDLFQNSDDNKVFIATWQKMGTGITLTAASYMIFVDTPWTEGVFTQACDRIHRIGSKEPVFIYNIIAKDTFDERVYEILTGKKVLSEYIIDDKVDPMLIDILKKFIEDL
jgi:SNF2 family DNA or RNA helicase